MRHWFKEDIGHFVQCHVTHWGFNEPALESLFHSVANETALVRQWLALLLKLVLTKIVWTRPQWVNAMSVCPGYLWVLCGPPTLWDISARGPEFCATNYPRSWRPGQTQANKPPGIIAECKENWTPQLCSILISRDYQVGFCRSASSQIPVVFPISQGPLIFLKVHTARPKGGLWVVSL